MADLNINKYEQVFLNEIVGAGVGDLPVNVVDTVSIAEYFEGSTGDLGVDVAEAITVAENVSSIPFRTASAYDNVTVSEDVVVIIGGEGATEVDYNDYTQDEISAVGMFTKAILPRRGTAYSGYTNISISNYPAGVNFSGTIVLQRSFDKGTTWHTVASYTVATETSFTDKEPGVRYRLGCPTTWTSGTALCRLGVGR